MAIQQAAKVHLAGLDVGRRDRRIRTKEDEHEKQDQSGSVLDQAAQEMTEGATVLHGREKGARIQHRTFFWTGPLIRLASPATEARSVVFASARWIQTLSVPSVKVNDQKHLEDVGPQQGHLVLEGNVAKMATAPGKTD